MSNKSLEQALANLLPTHAEALPPELIKHASSLLAQSRSYGSSLKPEEEIARPYVCAEIACRRLSKPLKLPPPLGRPPCPPRVYKKIYTYLEQALLKASARTTPKKLTSTSSSTSLRSPSKNAPAAATTANGSPFKRPLPSVSHSQKPENGTKPKARLQSKQTNGVSSQNTVKDAPSWTMPLIRGVCKALSTRTADTTPFSRPSISARLPPHVFAGVSSILSFVAETEDWGDDEAQRQFLEPLMTAASTAPAGTIYKERVATLVVAVYFVVLARRRPLANKAKSKSKSRSKEAEAETEGEKLDVDTYIEMARTALASVGLDGMGYVDDVDVWLSIIMTRKWTVGREWFENVPGPGKEGEGEGGVNEGELGDELEGGDDDEEDEIIGPKRRKAMRRQTRRLSGDNDGVKLHGGLQPGLGTMMQDRLNWLSEERREEYAKWKEGVMRRIRAIEGGVAAS
ncbi:hypothetical protein AJ79_07154 [Helicocarpus griseus UAMH5409]|uniref:ORC6 first cyclin-like domain-containing protein n=1 Tax=Helicocarpus griseus UAMH5409 TaxID=1447875 RepID=A0A2B7X5G7_9EURO|nr:hypothetical protein AJ79_07154 [Helicocarpus griseus UAMH5409]